MLAIRLVGAGAILFLGSGLALLRRSQLRLEWPECIVLAFALSYGWLFLLSVVLPLARLTIDAGALLSLTLIAVALFAGRRPVLLQRTRFRVKPQDILLIAAMGAVAVSTWWIESTVSGEETLDLVSTARFADGGAISFADMSLMPATRSVYLFQPYQLAIGMIARWTATEPLVAMIKLRPLFVFLSLTGIYALLRQLTPRREQGVAAMAVILVFIALDWDTWEIASLVPYARRGGFTEGVCIPVLLTLVFMATRRRDNEAGRRLGPISGVAAVLLVLGSMATHPLEVAPALFFVAALVVTVLLGFDPLRDRRRLGVLTVSIFLAVGIYLQVQRHEVPEVSEFEDQTKQAPRAELARLMRIPTQLIAGPMDRKGRSVLANDLPNSTAGALGVPALLLAAIVAPAAGVLLFLALVPFLLLHASPGGFLALSILTSPATAGGWSGYPQMIGLLALALALVSLAQSAMLLRSYTAQGKSTVATIATAVAVVGAVWLWGPTAAAWFLKFTAANPGAFVLLAAALGIPVALLARYSPRKTVPLLRARARFCAVITVATLAGLTFMLYRSSGPPPIIVNVRWSATIDSDARAALERQFSLTDGHETSDAAVRTYTMGDTSTANIRALVEHPAVEDTVHIDRRTFAVERPPRGFPVAKYAEPIGAAIAAIWIVGFLLPLGFVSRDTAVVPLPAVVALMALLMAIPLAGLGRPAPERVTLLDRLRAMRNQPSVVEWTRYYDVVRMTMNNPTPIRVPRTVVDALKARLPARKILLSNPDYSCALAALLDAYCVNPKETYGHYFLSAGTYLARYRQFREGTEPWHPFFNETWPPDDRERTMLQTFRVEYLLADPEHADLIQRKLDALGATGAVELRADGFVLYRF